MTHNGCKPTAGERFIRTLKDKNKKMTANSNKIYLGYLNELADQYKKTYHRSIDKRAIDPDYSALNKEIETSTILPKLKLE